MALTDSLISYWKMDEASGNALDAHGSNTLTDNNTVTSTTGIINTARQFTAANSEYLSHTDNTDLSTGDIDFTWAAWFRLDSSAAGAAKPIVVKGNNTSGAASNNEYSLYVWTDRIIYLDVYDGTNTGEVGASSFGVTGTGTWYFVVAWHDSVNDTVNIQVNNGTVDSVSYTHGVVDTTFPLEVGRGLGSSRYMDGAIDEVGFWKRVLTSGERTQLYNGGAGLAYPFTGGAATVGSYYYRFLAGAGG